MLWFFVLGASCFVLVALNSEQKTKYKEQSTDIYVEGDAQLWFHVPFKSINTEKLLGSSLSGSYSESSGIATLLNTSDP